MFGRLVDQLLADEAEERREAAHGEGGERDHGGGQRHGAGEARHRRVVARAGALLDHADGEEQAGLVEGVDEQEGHGRDDGAGGADAEQHHHQAEAHHRGVGEHQLEVGLPHRPDRGEEHGEAAHRHQHPGPELGAGERRGEAGEQVDAGLHHRRRVQVGRDRGGGGHGVRQPELERPLRRLGEGGEDDQPEDRRVERAGAEHLAHAVHRRQPVGAGEAAHQQQPRQHRQPAEPGDEQRLQRGGARAGLLVVEADQQPGGDGGALPEHEEGDRVVGGDQTEHRDREGDERQEQRTEPAIGAEIAGGVEEHHRADAADQEREGERQPVEPEGEVDAERRHPRQHELGDLAARHRGHEAGEPGRRHRGAERRQQAPGARVCRSGGQRDGLGQDGSLPLVSRGPKGAGRIAGSPGPHAPDPAAGAERLSLLTAPPRRINPSRPRFPKPRRLRGGGAVAREARATARPRAPRSYGDRR